MHTRLRQNPRLGGGAVVALAALIALIVWLVVESGGGSSSKPSASSTKPVAVSAGGLKTLAGALHRPIYWVGTKPNTLYEVTEASASRFYVRYLPKGTKAGDSSPHLTVATYAMPNAYNVMRGGPQGPGNTALPVSGGGIAVVNSTHPTSVYVAYPGSDYQIEVYDPNPAFARRLAVSGRVQPVLGAAASPARGPEAVSPQQLSALAASLGHPVYWAGPRANVTYELTETTDGRVYIRYVSKGLGVGTTQPFLTVATYPMANALSVTSGAAKDPNVTAIRLKGGGVAVYTKHHGTNIHLAYPGVNAQVEVYDPSSKVPPKLVTAGQIVPVG